jgi:hypothetical protein
MKISGTWTQVFGKARKKLPSDVWLKQMVESPDICEHIPATHDEVMLVYVLAEDKSRSTRYEYQ